MQGAGRPARGDVARRQGAGVQVHQLGAQHGQARAHLDEGARSLFGDDWERVASDIVGTLRMDAGRYPDDPKTSALVGELSMKSQDFRRWWADRKVVEFTHGTKNLHHPFLRHPAPNCRARCRHPLAT